MLYLASQFLWFLVAAFVIGITMGWVSDDGGKERLSGGVAAWVAGLWTLGAALTWLQFLNGVPARWVESALLFAAAYFAGCVLASFVRAAGMSEQYAIAGGADLDAAMPAAPAPVTAASPTAASAATLPAVEGEAELPGQRPAGRVETSRNESSLGQDKVTVLTDHSFDGERPKGLFDQARRDAPDDLMLLKGVGPAIAADLNRLGIWHFDQIAAMREAELRYISAFAGVPGRALTENWREDADILAHGGETAHSRAVKAGRKKPDDR
jgi:predicted flap endonuclease-1-like 5' DNA nuclease